MRIPVCFFFFAALGVHNLAGASLKKDSGTKEKDAAFSFAEVKYFHRFTKDDQHEYTPAVQEDLKAWKDMVTIHYYRKAIDGEALAAIANSV